MVAELKFLVLLGLRVYTTNMADLCVSGYRLKS